MWQNKNRKNKLRKNFKIKTQEMSAEQMEEDRLLASSPEDFSMDEQFLLQSSDEELDEYIENAGCMNRCLHALMSVRQELMQKGTVAGNYDHFLFHPFKD